MLINSIYLHRSRHQPTHPVVFTAYGARPALPDHVHVLGLPLLSHNSSSHAN
jgi:hypothetical protein